MKSTFTILSIAALCLSSFPQSIWAQASNTAVKDVVTKKLEQVQFYTELIEITSLEYADLMSVDSSSNDHTALRNILLDQVKEGKAKLIASSSIINRSGERCTTESIQEYIYATEYQPPGIPGSFGPDWKKSKPDVIDFPPLATAFETRNLGLTVEAECIIRDDNKTISITFKPELVKHVGDDIFLDWKSPNIDSKSKMPLFYNVRMQTSFNAMDGKFLLVSAMTPDLDGKPDHTRKVLVFVKATILKPEK